MAHCPLSAFAVAAAALSLLAPSARADDKLDMTFCTDAACSASCRSWMVSDGACAPGDSASSWFSSRTTLDGGWGGDRKTAFFVLYAGDATSASCPAGRAVANATVFLDGDCHATGPPLNGSFRSRAPAAPWVTALIVVFGILLPIAVVCGCSYYCCCRPGACCNSNMPKPVAPAASPTTGSDGAPFYASGAYSGGGGGAPGAANYYGGGAPPGSGAYYGAPAGAPPGAYFGAPTAPMMPTNGALPQPAPMMTINGFAVGVGGGAYYSGIGVGPAPSMQQPQPPPQPLGAQAFQQPQYAGPVAFAPQVGSDGRSYA